MKNLTQKLQSFFVALLMLISSFSIAQTKFSSLNDACTRRTSESTRSIYAPSFAVGQYAYLNNSSKNFRRLASGYYYNPSLNSAFQTNLSGTITAIQTCAVANGSLQIKDTYTKGLSGDSNFQVDEQGSLWYYRDGGNYKPENAWSQMSVNYNASTGKIDVILDLRGWGDGDIAGSYRRFKVEVSSAWLTEAEIEAIDFRNQAGKDISIVGANFRSNGEIMDSKQTILHIAGNSTTDVPTFFKRPANMRIGTPSYFPTFATVTGKKNVMSYGSLDASFNFENQQYLSKGYDIVAKKGNSAIPQNKTIITDYDNWAKNVGSPDSNGGNNNQAATVQWLADTPMSNLSNGFKEVIDAGKISALMFLDFELWGFEIFNNQTACNRLASLFREFRRVNPNCLLTSYINAKPIDIKFGKNISSSQMAAENAKYNQSYQQLMAGFYGKQIQYVNLSTGAAINGDVGYMGDYMSVGIAGDYLHTYNESNFYAFIQEMELFKKLSPNQKIISLYWSYIETLPNQSTSDINTVRRYYKKSNNFFYFSDYKMASPMSDIYNRGMWSNFIGDGQLVWADPHNAVNSFDYHGGNAKDIFSEDYIKDTQSNQFVSNTNLGQMEISTTIGYDYNQLALYELSLNNDIIPSATQTVDFSIDGGATYYTGEDLKPASAEFKKIPIVRIKKHPTLNEWLVLAMNKNLEHYQNQTIRVRISGKTVDIVLKGQFSTLKRVKSI
jgi:hypothetical protein